MKNIAIILFTLNCSLFQLFAAVPLRWTVETSRAVPAQFEAYQGETLALEAALQSYGKPLEAPSNYSLYWQTNGMGNAWWSTNFNHTIEQSEQSNNVLRATWTPSMETGAKAYNCFIGQPGTIYHAAFQLRLRPSPGATPNELPLPQKVIDFAKVTVLNPPWSGGGGGGVDTNAVIDIIHKTVDGSARTLPPYLHYLEMDDTYPDAAAEWYAQADYSHGSCSSVRDGGFLYRNYDWNFDFMPEFVVLVHAGPCRFASLSVCNVGTNLTETDVTSGKWSKWYKALPGHAVDGINENGVACNINVVDGEPSWFGGVSPALHPLAAIRWILDNATNAQQAATYIASHIVFPQGWSQNFHYMIADETSTYIVENGSAHAVTNGVPTLTNFPLFPTPAYGPGWERYALLTNSTANITNAWYTRAYSRSTNWISEFSDADEMEAAKYAWETHAREKLRGHGLWQSVHTSVYDITNRTLRVAVQEQDDWYVFQVPSAGGTDETKVRTIVKPMIESHHDNTKLDKSGGEVTGRLHVYGDFSVFSGLNVYGGDTDLSAGFLKVLSWSSITSDSEIQPNLHEFIKSGDWNTSENPFIRSSDLEFALSVKADRATTLSGYGITDAAPLSMISATNQTFSNEVATVARKVSPPPSPYLRLYDEVRQCWWIGRMVNGVMQWEVE